MKEEEWKPVPGYEGLYKSDYWGHVWSVSHIVEVRNQTDGTWRRNTKSKQLKPQLKHGYYQVRLFKDGIGKWVAVHRIVASAWIPNPDNKPQVDHIDGNRLNNAVSNLRWTTVPENANNPITIERKRYSTRCKQVNQYTLDGILVNTYKSANEVTRQTGYLQGNISACCRGEHRHAYGFIWRYA